MDRKTFLVNKNKHDNEHDYLQSNFLFLFILFFFFTGKNTLNDLQEHRSEVYIHIFYKF